MNPSTAINDPNCDIVNSFPDITLVHIPLTDKEIKYHQLHMDNALRAAEMSHCERRKVGAVVVKDGHTISSGWNGMPEGFPNVCELDGDVTNPLVRHAERNALERFMGRSESTSGCVMYSTTCPCLDCAVTIKTRAKLTQVYFKDLYRTPHGVVYLLNNAVDVYQFSGKEMYKCKLKT